MFILDRIKYRHRRVYINNVKLKIKYISYNKYNNITNGFEGEYVITIINNINLQKTSIVQGFYEGIDIDLLLKNGILDKQKVIIAKQHNEILKSKMIYKDIY